MCVCVQLSYSTHTHKSDALTHQEERYEDISGGGERRRQQRLHFPASNGRLATTHQQHQHQQQNNLYKYQNSRIFIRKKYNTVLRIMAQSIFLLLRTHTHMFVLLRNFADENRHLIMIQRRASSAARRCKNSSPSPGAHNSLSEKPNLSSRTTRIFIARAF